MGALHHRGDQLDEVEPLELEAVLVVQREAVVEVGDQRGHGQRGAVQLLEVPAHHRVEHLVLEEDLAQAEDDLGRVGQVVHGHGVETPLRGELTVDPAQLAQQQLVGGFVRLH